MKGLFWLFFVLGSYAQDCAPGVQGSVPLEAEHPAQAILDRLLTKADSSAQPVKLCVLDNPQSSYVVAYMTLRTIGFSRYTLTRFSAAALTGALAHELGHIFLGSLKTHEQSDQVADAFTVRLVGVSTLRATYLAHGLDKATTERRITRAVRITQLAPLF